MGFTDHTGPLRRPCPKCGHTGLVFRWTLAGIDVFRCSNCECRFEHVERHQPGIGIVCGLRECEDVPDPAHDHLFAQAHEAEFWPCFPPPALAAASLAFLKRSAAAFTPFGPKDIDSAVLEQ
jgi:hypothetical protein